MRIPYLGHQGLEQHLCVAYQGHFHRHVPSHLSCFYVQVDDPGVGRKGGCLSGDPVVEAHSQAYDQVGLVHRQVGPVHAVHAQHPKAQVMISGKPAKTQEGGDDRDASGLGQG